MWRLTQSDTAMTAFVSRFLFIYIHYGIDYIPYYISSVYRYVKQAIVDKNQLVSSSALISGTILYKISPEVSNIV